MPRRSRAEYARSVYHVMSRGNHSQKVFWGDVTDSQTATFAQPQPTGIDQRQAGPVAQLTHHTQNPPDLLAREHDGQLVLRAGTRNIHRRPVTLEHLLKEELNPTQRDRSRG
ncbi:MAG: hypothetical protein PHI93_11775, partial [Kiritimatiellae bacterium]|nr:hypothetical protein [Kiritimatiellia bacterium]